MCRRTEGTFTTPSAVVAFFVILALDTKLQTYLLKCIQLINSGIILMSLVASIYVPSEGLRSQQRQVVANDG